MGAAVLVIPLPQRLHRGQHLAHEGTALLLRDAAGHAIESELIGAAADAELQPAVGENITECRLGRHPYRVPIRRHDHGSAKPDRAGIRGPVRQDRERIGCDGEFDRVVLWCPGDLETAFFRDLHQFQRASHDCAHVEPGIEAFQTDRNRKLQVLLLSRLLG